jgi:hypothetical protein
MPETTNNPDQIPVVSDSAMAPSDPGEQQDPHADGEVSSEEFNELENGLKADDESDDPELEEYAQRIGIVIQGLT